jgi:Family of unknown function (DUF6929)
MITLTKVRQLDLSATTSGRPLHLSAASGLACLNSFNYVVADDELHLGVFRANSSEPGHLIRLFEGELPACKADRKKQKADFEALTLLPSYGDYPFGALLAFGSGSRPNRRLGALLGTRKVPCAGHRRSSIVRLFLLLSTGSFLRLTSKALSSAAPSCDCSSAEISGIPRTPSLELLRGSEHRNYPGGAAWDCRNRDRWFESDPGSH